MNELQIKLDAIKLDKDTNLLPQNLRSGVSCLGVYGTMEPGTDTSDATAVAGDILVGKTAYVGGEKIVGTLTPASASNIHWFSTVEEMNASQDNNDGDLATVYRNAKVRIPPLTPIHKMFFEYTVTLDSPVENTYSTDIVDTGLRFRDSVFTVTPTSMEFFIGDYTNDYTIVHVQYESSDGVNYTRMSATGDFIVFYDDVVEIDLRGVAEISGGPSYESLLNKFIYVQELNFGGLYEYDGDTSAYVALPLGDTLMSDEYNEALNTARDISGV